MTPVACHSGCPAGTVTVTIIIMPVIMMSLTGRLQVTSHWQPEAEAARLTWSVTVPGPGQ